MFKLSHLFFMFFLPLFSLASEEGQHHSLHFSIIISPLPRGEQIEAERLYTFASTQLSSFKANNPNDISQLLMLVKEVSALKDSPRNPQLNETYLGSLAYAKVSSWYDNINAKLNHYHVALFFFRLREYNSLIDKYNKITPTIDEWKKLKYNAELAERQNAALEKGITFGIHISKDSIDRKKPPFHEINDNIAVEDFLKLTKDCEKLVNETNQEVVKNLADTIYLNILSPKTVIADHPRL